MNRNRIGVWALALVMAGLSGSALAQEQQNNGGRQRQRGGQNQDANGGNAGGRQRGGDPAQFREQMMTRLKERMGASDDEWKVIQPKLEKVMAVQRDGRGGGGFTRGGRGGDRGGDNNNATQREQSALGKAQADLRAALDDKSTSAEEINKRLAALREVREKSRADRAAAQKELKEILSARQEAALVSSGILE